MDVLTSWPWWLLLVTSVLIIGGLTLAARAVMVAVFRSAGTTPSRHAGPLMPTLGALFAFLSAFVIATEWSAQVQSQNVVLGMASRSTQLAWASTAPGVDTAAIQRSIVTALDSAVADEWPHLAESADSMPVESETFRTLERTVRDSADSKAVSTPAANELLTSLDALAQARRDLSASADTSLPPLLFAALLFSGLALAINAVTLTISGERRAAFVVTSVVLIVAVDLAVILVLGSPFRGTVTTSPRPLEQAAARIESGWYTR